MFYFYQILSSFNKLKTISEVVLLLPNTVSVKRAEDYIRGCSTSTKYCPPLTSWRLYQRVFYFYQILSSFYKLKTISEGGLLLPNTVTLKQVEDYIRRWSTSTKYCHPLTSWRLYQRVFYFYQILSPLNKLKTISEGVLLLPNTVTLEQVEDYIYQRVFYFYQILSPFNKLKTISEGVLLLPNTVTLEQVEDYIRGCSTSTKCCHPWTSWRLYQRVFYFYQILSSFNKLKTISEGVLLLPNTVTLEQVEDYIRGCSTSTKCCHPWTSWRLYQRVFYFYQILSSFNKLKTISEGVLLLPNTVTLEQVEDYIRGCSTSTKYCYPWTSWRLYQRMFYFYQILLPLNKLKTISEGVLLLPNTVLNPEGVLLYQILSPLNKLKTISEGVLLLPNTVPVKRAEDYIRGCSTSTKYCHPLTSWRLYQRVFYFYQILSPLNKLKTISEGVLLLPNTVTF